ncbi:MAG: molybdenum cofactor guanylyltransferase [Syntrophaceae bacterium]|nr:molybdenum cofactor guanylyltransferase [Syntrophaceae bacterium]
MTGIILSGGRSRRMGENKAFFKLNGERLIDRVVRIFQSLFSEVIIVTTAPLDYLDQKATVVMDILPVRASLGGIYTGLFHSTDEKAFVAACDMPFLNKAFITHLINLSPGYDIVVPVVPEGFHPLHAIYDRRCLHAIRRRLDRGHLKTIAETSRRLDPNLKVTAFYPGHRLLTIPPEICRRFDPELRMFWNLNTHKDMEGFMEP